MIGMLWAKIDVLLVYFLIWTVGFWMGVKLSAWWNKPKFWRKQAVV